MHWVQQNGVVSECAAGTQLLGLVAKVLATSDLRNSTSARIAYEHLYMVNWQAQTAVPLLVGQQTCTMSLAPATMSVAGHQQLCSAAARQHMQRNDAAFAAAYLEIMQQVRSRTCSR